MRIIFAILLCIVSLVVINYSLYALELVKEKGLVRIIIGDFDGDGIDEEVILKPKEREKKESWYNYNLEVKSKGELFLLKDVTFSNDYSCRLEKIVVSDSTTPFIGISQTSGTHSWLLILYAFNGKEITKIDTFLSNFPSIEINDVDNDGENEIVVTNRDYESSNPLEDHLTEVYNYDGEEWRRMSVYSTRTKKFIPPDEWLQPKSSRKDKRDKSSLNIKIYK